jgi:hypothetical protein
VGSVLRQQRGFHVSRHLGEWQGGRLAVPIYDHHCTKKAYLCAIVGAEKPFRHLIGTRRRFAVTEVA